MVVKLGEKAGKKQKVYGDGQFLFALYPKEIRYNQLEDEAEISEELVEKILKESVLPRAKLRLMNILMRGDKSEAELRRSLRNNYYDEDTIDKAIAYVDSFHYINEARAAESYIRAHIFDYSEKEIRFKLESKGYVDEAIDTAYDIVLADYEDSSPEIEAAKKMLRKKLGMSFDPEAENARDIIEKAMAAAYRKGFRYDDIKKALNELSSNE